MSNDAYSWHLEMSRYNPFEHWIEIKFRLSNLNAENTFSKCELV